jgi:hypothetical protein
MSELPLALTSLIGSLLVASKYFTIAFVVLLPSPSTVA